MKSIMTEKPLLDDDFSGESKAKALDPAKVPVRMRELAALI